MPDNEEKMICSQIRGRFKGAGLDDCSDVATSHGVVKLQKLEEARNGCFPGTSGRSPASH